MLPTNPPYTLEEVLENFSALLDSLDFSRELALLGVGRLHFKRRNYLTRELRALHIALWHLALQRSFPQEWKILFETFLQRFEDDPEETRPFSLIVRSYVEMLKEKGDSDFMGVSAYFINLSKKKTKSSPGQSLRLALMIRDNYTMIFERLI